MTHRTGRASWGSSSATKESSSSPTFARSTALAPPPSFPFPFEPYPIQTALMHHLYTCYEKGGLGVFESPTGTGKTLSILCSAMKWLVDDETQLLADIKSNTASIKAASQHFRHHHHPNTNVGTNKASPSTTETQPFSGESKMTKKKAPSWVKKKRSDLAQSDAMAEHTVYYDVLEEKIDEINAIRAGMAQHVSASRLKRVPRGGLIQYETKGSSNGKGKQLHDDAFSDDFDIGYDAKGQPIPDDAPAEFLLDEDADDDVSDGDALFGESDVFVRKIYFCSRTHSQLSQFVHEVQNSPFRDARLTVLGSRAHLCTNASVSKLASVNDINEKCLDMQKEKEATAAEGKKRRKNGTCPQMDRPRIAESAKRILASPGDIEDAVHLCKKMHTAPVCAYYASRAAVPLAQIVLVPYNLLLHKQTRESVGLNLKGNIVIIDEAHNLIDTIAALHTVIVTKDQLADCFDALWEYYRKYSHRLLEENATLIMELLHLVRRWKSHLMRDTSGSKDLPDSSTGSEILTVTEFLETTQHRKGSVNASFVRLLHFCERSNLANKLLGFLQHAEAKRATEDAARTKEQPTLSSRSDAAHSPRSRHISPLSGVLQFMQALTTQDADGRIVITRNESTGGLDRSLKFMLLNPSVYFNDILREARSVVVIGGTMGPTSVITSELIGSSGALSVPTSTARPGTLVDGVQHHSHSTGAGRQGKEPRSVLKGPSTQAQEYGGVPITEYRCTHVVPKENVFSAYLTMGERFQFNYQNKQDTKWHDSMLMFLGKQLGDIATSLQKGGIVVFFCSYSHEQQANRLWTASGVTQTLERLGVSLFREEQGSGSVDACLSGYCAAVEQGRVALLTAVVGGKLSEGINFKDDLGRCVVIVGMPYPNKNSPELREKLNYLDEQHGDRSKPPSHTPNTPNTASHSVAQPRVSRPVTPAQPKLCPEQSRKSKMTAELVPSTPSQTQQQPPLKQQKQQQQQQKYSSVPPNPYAKFLSKTRAQPTTTTALSCKPKAARVAVSRTDSQRALETIGMRPRNTPKRSSMANRYYESLCMNAINQSIGRAIRHKGDYAAILFADHRYTQPHVQSKLPGWITHGGLAPYSSKELSDFFASKTS